MLGIASLLLLTARTGSYGLAGTACAALAVANAAATPLVSRRLDRRSPRAVLPPLVAAHVLAGGAFVAAATLDAPAVVLIGLALLAGASQPQVGAVSRRRWAARLGEGPRLRRAYALETVVDETVFVIGPAAATALAAAYPPAGVLAALACAALGVPWFAFRPEPAPPAAALPTAALPVAAPAIAGTGDGLSASASASAGVGGGPRGRAVIPVIPVIRLSGMAAVVATFIGVGAVFGSAEVALVATGREHGLRAEAGALPILLTLSSLAMSVRYGSMRWRATLPRRLRLAALAGVAAVAPLLAGGGLALPALCALALGAPVACVLITGNTLVGRIVPVERATEGFAWLTVATGLGVAVASPLTGEVVDRFGARTGTVVLVAAAVWVAGAATRVREPGPVVDRPQAGRKRAATAGRFITHQASSTSTMPTPPQVRPIKVSRPSLGSRAK
jgi:hypothetical protein